MQRKINYLKYLDTAVTFSEVPDEISLCINITGCPNHCKGCHSQYLWEDSGEPLDLMHLCDLIDTNSGVTCVCLMGGDKDPSEINYIAEEIKNYYPKLKTAWYSGKQELSKDIDLRNFNYVKLGPYIEEKGPLNSRTTNQIMLQITVIDDKVFTKDITSRFWK